MKIIEQHRDEYGLNNCLQALSVAKSSWHYRQNGYGRAGAKEKKIEREMRQILADHPDYGRPRMTPELRERLGYRINHKRVERLLRNKGWGMIRHLPRRSHRAFNRFFSTGRGSWIRFQVASSESWKRFRPTLRNCVTPRDATRPG